MISRRQMLWLSASSAAALALPGCAASPPLRKDIFPDYGDPARPYRGLPPRCARSTITRREWRGSSRPGSGCTVSNGPGLFDRGGKRKRNLLDGDGMVQAFRFHDRGVRYQNRFVRTVKFVNEEKAGRFIYPSWSTQAPGGFIGNFWCAGRLKSQAGITVFPWQGKLYALMSVLYRTNWTRKPWRRMVSPSWGLPKA